MTTKYQKHQDGHHHHKHMDDSEVFKQKTLGASRRRKRFAKALYRILWFIAIVIVAITIYIYTN